MQQLYKKHRLHSIMQAVKKVTFLFLIAVLPALVSAQNYTPNTFADPVITSINNATGAINGGATITLRSALLAADNLGGSHTITLSTGTYNLDGSATYTISGPSTFSARTIYLGNSAQNITINGNGPGNTIVNMATAGRDRIMTINYNGDVPNVITTINGVKFTNGYLTNDEYGGAAIYAGPIAGLLQTLNISNCAFDNNICPTSAGNGGVGGAIYMFQETINIDNSTFTNNKSVDGVGGAIFYTLYNNQGNKGNVSITNSTFSGNSARDNGGAIHITSQGGQPGGITFVTNISNNTFLGNFTTVGDGGAMALNNGANLSILQVHYNRFVGNVSAASATTSGMLFVNSAGSVNADNNWWGCNTGPTAAGTCDKAAGIGAPGGGSLIMTKWLQLKTTASPTTICNTAASVPTNTSTITTSFLTNSANEAISTANLSTLIGRTVNWGPTTLGSLSGQQGTIQASGTATALFTSNGTGGTATINAQVDNVPTGETTASRASITVNTASVAPTGVTGATTVCSGNTTTLTVSGGSKGTAAVTQWFTGSCGGALVFTGDAFTTPALVTNATYFVRYTGTCNTTTCATINVFVNDVTGGTVGSDQTICSGGDPAVFTESVASTGTGSLTYQWQSNTISCAGVFNNIGGATSATFDAPAGLAATTYYRRVTTSTLNGVTCTANSNCITVTINNVTGGTVGSDQTFCTNADPAVFTQSVASTGSGVLTYQWQSSTTSCGAGFSDIGGATSITYDAPAGLLVTTYYRRVTTSTLSAIPCTAVSNCITVSVNNVTGGTVGTDQTVCSGGDPAAFTQSVASTGGGALTYQWQSNTTGCGGVFVNIGGATAFTYDPPAGLLVTTYYRRVTTSTLNAVQCTANSNCITVSVNNVTGGTVGSDQTICSAGDPAAFTETVASTGTGALTYQWQSSTTSCAAGFGNIGGATSATYDAPAGVALPTYYRRVTTSTLNGVPCTANSNCITVTINNVTAGTVGSDQVICTGGDPAAFTQSIASTGSGVLTYQWQSSTTNCASGFGDIGGATSITYDAPAGLAATTYYRRVTTSTLAGIPCAANSNCITVTVTPNNTITLTSASGTDNQIVPVNTPITNITYSTTGAMGATFSGLPSGVTGSFTGGNLVTISGSPTTAVGSPFSYTVTLTGGCGAVSTTGTITVTTCGASLTSAPGTNAQLACINTAITNITYSTTGATGATFAGLPPGVTGIWSANVITISGSPNTIVGSPFNYTITLTGGTCSGQTVTGSITVNALPVVSITGSSSICAACPSGPGTTVYTANLNGPAESPSNASPGTGTATITVNTVTNTMRVQCTFSGLTGTTTASHVHSATAVANTGTAGVATTTPTFVGFPLGVTSGTYDNTLDMTLASSYNPTYITANGGTPASAFAALQAGLDANKAYFNVHSSTFPGGEIRGFLSTFCSSANSSTTLSPTSGGTWTSSNPAVATVTNAGVVNGVSTGSATFTFKNTGTTCSATTAAVTVNPSNTVTAPSSTPTVCINTALINITHSTTGATGIGTPLGLPAGVTAAWAANTITISGTPSVSGVYNYTIPLTGGCGGVAATGTITVTPNNTIALTSAVGTNAQTVCINTAITNITYSTTTATGATFAGLPGGVTGNWAGNVVTISGTPTASGTFNYTVTLTGGCGTVTATGSITVTPNNTITLTSLAGTNAQSVCINSAIANITYSTTGATGATFAGLPAGVAGNWAANVVTISGTPTASGTFNYTVTLTGGCGNITAIGSITVNPSNTISLTSGVGTNSQTRCINTAITNITYATTGATGATFGGLPAGVTGNWAGNVVTISGAPTASGTFNYTVTLTGGCGNVTATGSITVTPNNTITLTSAVGTNNQTVLINTPITNITYSTTGATGANFTGLPAGVTGNWAGNVATISGTPTASGTFNYTVTLTGGCGTITATGTINVVVCSITLTSSAGTNAQTICQNSAITNITYSTTGATGASFTGLPTGVTGNWAANVVTISGTATASGTFNYTVTLTGGGCGAFTATGTITVNPTPTVNTVSDQVVCNNTSTAAVNFTGTPAGVVFNWTNNTPSIGLAASGTGNIASFTATNATNAPVTATVTVTPITLPLDQSQTSNTTCMATFSQNDLAQSFKPAANTVCGARIFITSGIGSGTGDITIQLYSNLPNAAGVLLAQGTATGIGAGQWAQVSWSSVAVTPGTTYYLVFTSTNSSLCVSGDTGNPYANGQVYANSGFGPFPFYDYTFETFTCALPCTGTPKTFTYTVNPTPNAVATPSAQTICSGSAITTIVNSGNVAGTVYTWTRDNIAAVTGIAASGAGNISGSLTNTTNAPVTVTFTITPSYTNAGTTCTGTPVTATVVVNPMPNAVPTPSAQTICSGSAITTIALTGNVSGTVFNWTRDNSALVTGIAASGTGNISGNLTNTTTAPVSVTFTITPSYTNAGTTCTGTPITATVVVNPISNAVATPVSQTICSSTAITTIVNSGNVAGTVYNWVRDNNATVTGIAANGAGNISGTLTNTTNAPITVTFTITPSYTNAGTTCTGTPITATVLVNPTPNAVATPSAQTICSGSAITTIALTGNVSGTVFNWTRDNSAIATGIAASGTGNINGNLTNTTTAPVTVTFTITPSYTNGGTTCTGTPITATVIVNPIPDVTQPVNQVVCNGAPTTTVTFTGSAPGTVYNWTNNIPAIGLAGSGTGNIASFTATNTTSAPLVATITVTPTFTNGGTTCSGPSKTFTITVNPTATVNTVANQVLCNGANSNAVTFSSPTTGGTIVYNWTNNTTSIGLGASGVGNIPSFVAVNTTNAPIVATITVTPTYTNGAVSCVGTAITFTITVNPPPIVNPVANQVICNNSTTTTVVFSTPTTGGSAVYNWTNNNTTIGLAAGGTGDIPGFIGFSAGNTPNVATITVTMTYTSGGISCVSLPVSFTITVNPTPTVNLINDQVVCNGAATTAVVFSSPQTGGTIVYNWTNTGAFIGLGPNGTGNIPSFIATNTGLTPATATITVTATYTGSGVSCSGPSRIFTITVNPTPTVNQPTNQAVCAGSTTATVVFTGAPPATIYSWTNSNTSIGLAASGNGNILSFVTTNTTNVAQVATITVTPFVFGCTGTAKTFTITVNPIPTVNAQANQTVCAGTTVTATFTGAVTGTVYDWTNSNPAIGLIAAGSGNINFLSTNTTAAPISGTITVTPTYTNGGTSCTGAPITFTVTVNPVPTVNAVANQTVCNGSPTAAVAFSGPVPGTVFNWTNSNTTIGLAASGTGNIGSFTGTNATNAPVTATITVSPVFTGGPTTCTGTPITFTITINPTPSVNAIANQTVCAGSNTTAVTITGSAAGTVYNWTNSNPAIGLNAAGTNTIPSFVAVNNTAAPVTATIIVTPVFSNGGVSCTGTPTTFTITVNPKPTVNPIANQTVCNGTNTSAINFTGSVAGTIYNWTNNNTTIGLAATGSGNIASFTAVNATGVPVTATITVTPTSASSCIGTSVTFSITVNPTPSVNQPGNQAVCAGSTTAAVIFTGSPAGTTYTWTNSNISIGLAASGSGNLPAFVTINPTTSPITATITVTPMFGIGGVSCTGFSKTFTITVNPQPNIIFSNFPPRVCLTDTLVNLATKVSPAGGIWSGTGVSGSTFSATSAGVGTYNLSYTVNGPGGCTATSYVTVTVDDCKERHNVFATAIRIYPNPSSGRFNIRFLSDIYSEFNVRVIDGQGRVFRSQKMTGLIYGSVIPMNLTDLAGGTYFLQIYNNVERAEFPIVIVR